MSSLNVKNFSSPDETRTPDKTHIDIIDLGGAKVSRVTFQPGWKWSEAIKPVAGTDSCQAHHVGMLVEGSIHVVQNDGTEVDINAGDSYVIEPGHDAWVVGDTATLGYEFNSAAVESYAAPS